MENNELDCWGFLIGLWKIEIFIFIILISKIAHSSLLLLALSFKPSAKYLF